MQREREREREREGGWEGEGGREERMQGDTKNGDTITGRATIKVGVRSRDTHGGNRRKKKRKRRAVRWSAGGRGTRTPGASSLLAQVSYDVREIEDPSQKGTAPAAARARRIRNYIARRSGERASDKLLPGR